MRMPIGTIVEVHGPVVHIRCDTLPPLQQALVTQNGKSLYTFEVYQHLDREHLRAITLPAAAPSCSNSPATWSGQCFCTKTMD